MRISMAYKEFTLHMRVFKKSSFTREKEKERALFTTVLGPGLFPTSDILTLLTRVEQLQ
jgi:hypothetical protein